MCGAELRPLPDGVPGEIAPDYAPVPALLERLRLLDEGGYFDPAYDDGPPSPCVSVCRMDADRRYCQGCLRSIDEIRAWSRSDAAGRRAIWARIAVRAGADVPALSGH